MDADAKKTALRMIPYGIYAMTAQAGETIAAATVNWVTQSSFNPPLVVVGVKADSGAYAVAKDAGKFALNMLGKGQQGIAFAFFKPADVDDGKINGEPYHSGKTGAPVLANAIERGDHHIFIGEVIEATVGHQPDGRPDAAILEMKDLGDNVFYGG